MYNKAFSIVAMLIYLTDSSYMIQIAKQNINQVLFPSYFYRYMIKNYDSKIPIMYTNIWRDNRYVQ